MRAKPYHEVFIITHWILVGGYLKPEGKNIIPEVVVTLEDTKMSELLFFTMLLIWSVYAMSVNLYRKDYCNSMYWAIAILACLARLCYML